MSPWMDAILLNWGVRALRVPVPYGQPCVISCTTRLSNVEVAEIHPTPTGRILIYDLLEFVAIHIWEAGVVNVLLELCIGPGWVIRRN